MGVYIKNMTLDEFYEYGDDCQTLIGIGQADEVPPHGRLIDADAAYDEFLNLMKIQGAIDPCQLGRILVCAPTIIEAEKEE